MPLDLLAAAPAGELAFLHSADNQGHSVLAFDPLYTFEIPVTNRSVLLSLRSGLDAYTLQADVAVPLVGYIGGISYDVGRHLETIASHAVDDMGWPLARFTLFRRYFVLDHAASAWIGATLQLPGDPPTKAAATLAEITAFLRNAGVSPASVSPAGEGGRDARITHCITQDDYLGKVERVQAYIAAGDIYQANLAQRWTIQTSLPAVELYRRLVGRSPAPYAALLQWPGRAVISASPELFLNREGTLLETRPIKGTRRRSADPAADAQLRDALLASPKDRAELAMIVDLLRNDLGRVCEFGSIRVIDPRLVEAHPTVWHTLAVIQGRCGASWAEILAALVPGGSITGAPKIRAMQIIEELEPTRRGWYCGNIGWIGPANTGTLNIAIRTILMAGETAWVHAGGGVVADSQAPDEYDETLAKAAAMLAALGVERAVRPA